MEFRLDSQELESSLREFGFARIPAILTLAECSELISLYADESRFRNVIHMERFNLGVGEYKYFREPLPEIVARLRGSAYPPLAGIAVDWMRALGIPAEFPESLDDFHQICAKNGQHKPTPLMLRYEAGGYNRLHQDLYGPVVFPFQMTCFLNAQHVDYEGGEFVLVEQRPRAQSRAEVIIPQQGELLIFTTCYRPVRGSRGYYRVNVRHGTSRVTSGVRYALGVIFHNAK